MGRGVYILLECVLDLEVLLLKEGETQEGKHIPVYQLKGKIIFSLKQGLIHSLLPPFKTLSFSLSPTNTTVFFIFCLPYSQNLRTQSVAAQLRTLALLGLIEWL